MHNNIFWKRYEQLSNMKIKDMTDEQIQEYVDKKRIVKNLSDEISKFAKNVGHTFRQVAKSFEDMAKQLKG